MCSFKWNSSLNSSATLSSTSNESFGTSLYRPQSPLFGAPSDLPSRAPSIVLGTAPWNAKSNVMSNPSLLSSLCGSSIAL